MRMRPYIGITDFTDFEQVTLMLDVFRKHKSPASQRLLHVGVMMSNKTLNGIETKWSKVFPPKETIADIFRSNDDDVLNCLHYADYDRHTGFASDLARAIRYGGPNIHAVQLDMVWPDPVEVFTAEREAGKWVEVILQIGAQAMEMEQNDPARITARLWSYFGIVDRVLLDKSMGKGLGMDAAGLIPFAQAIKDRFPDLGLGGAGGLGPNSIGLVEPLAKVFPDISIDAQAKLRPSGSALDPIDCGMAGAYLVKALDMLR